MAGRSADDANGMGSGYLVGAYFFARMSFGRRWHHHGIPLPAVAIFASTMALLTVIHWENFTHDHLVQDRRCWKCTRV